MTDSQGLSPYSMCRFAAAAGVMLTCTQSISQGNEFVKDFFSAWRTVLKNSPIPQIELDFLHFYFPPPRAAAGTKKGAFIIHVGANGAKFFLKPAGMKQYFLAVLYNTSSHY